MVSRSDNEPRLHEALSPVCQYALFDWTLNFTEQRFWCDADAMAWLLGDRHDGVAIDELFELLPKSQRRAATELFQSVLMDGEVRVFHCCVMPPNCLFAYLEFHIERESAVVLRGTVRPLMVIPNREVAAEVFYAVFENPHHGLIVTDEQTRILACNRYFEQKTGYLRSDVVGLKTSIFNADKHSASHYQQMWQHIEQNGYWTGTMLTQGADNIIFPQELTVQRISLSNDRSYYLGFCVDLSNHLHRLEEREGGGVDMLTQLPTQEKFYKLLQGLCTQERSGGLILFALRPHFDESERLFQKRDFARMIADHPDSLLNGYLGNGRFVTCIEYLHYGDKRDVREIRKAIKHFLHVFRRANAALYEALFNGSTGISIYGVDARSAGCLFTHANQALLELPTNTTQNFRFYDTSLHQQIERKKQLETMVSKSIVERQLEVAFQPIIDLRRWCIDKYESLCRFPFAEQEKVTTQELINIAEDLDLISQLDMLVGDLALSALPHLKALAGESVGITINSSFNSSKAAEEVLSEIARLVERSGVAPQSVTIEITENAYFETESTQANILQLIRDQGVTIAVDDFGTGYSSFQYLKACHFDVLKIDRNFVTGINLCSNNYHIVKTLVELSHLLGLVVVAEGVETEQELAVLCQLNVDFAQGYVFSRPVSLTELASHHKTLDLSQYQQTYGRTGLISRLATANLPHLDPSDPISLAYRYFQTSEIEYLPIVDNQRCVGVVNRAAMNLHLTPAMGTDLETTREATIWNKPVNQVMVTKVQNVNWQIPLQRVMQTVEQMGFFPWVLVDEAGRFKGLVEVQQVFQHLQAEQRLRTHIEQ